MADSISRADPGAGRLDTIADERVYLRKRTLPRWDKTSEVCVGRRWINVSYHDIRGGYHEDHEFCGYRMPISALGHRFDALHGR